MYPLKTVNPIGFIPPERVDDNNEVKLHQTWYGWEPWWIFLTPFLALHSREWAIDTGISRDLRPSACFSWCCTRWQRTTPSILHLAKFHSASEFEGTTLTTTRRDYRVFNILYSSIRFYDSAVSQILWCFFRAWSSIFIDVPDKVSIERRKVETCKLLAHNFLFFLQACYDKQYSLLQLIFNPQLKDKPLSQWSMREFNSEY